MQGRELLQVLQFVHGIAVMHGDLGVPGSAEMALQLFLTATPASSEVAGLELITYDFFEQVQHCFHTLSSLHTIQYSCCSKSLTAGLELVLFSPCVVVSFMHVSKDSSP